jgi:vesicle transport protein SEC22
MELIFIARTRDSMMLCASLDKRGGGPYTRQVTEILKGLQNNQNHNGSMGQATKCSIQSSDGMSFHYILDRGVCFITLTNSKFPKRLVFGFLEELRVTFHGFVTSKATTHGSNFSNEIQNVTHAYAYITFDQTIQKKKREYSNPDSSDNMRRLKEELTDITNIMSQNIDDILKRGENLEDLGQRSRTLKNSSKVFEKQAKWLRMCKVRRRVVWCVLVICCCCWWCCCLRGNGGSRIQMGCVLIVVLTV